MNTSVIQDFSPAANKNINPLLKLKIKEISPVSVIIALRDVREDDDVHRAAFASGGGRPGAGSPLGRQNGLILEQNCLVLLHLLQAAKYLGVGYVLGRLTLPLTHSVSSSAPFLAN
jgi:hypothetical protein